MPRYPNCISQYLASVGYQVLIGTRSGAVNRPAWLGQGGLVKLDLNSDAGLEHTCRQVDAVVHLAALNEIDSAVDPVAAFQTNTVGTYRLVRAAGKAGVKRLIYFSTAHVYGAPLRGCLTEDVVPMPVHPYAYTHRAAEDVVLAAHQRELPAALVFRLSNAFGAPERAEVNRWTLLVNDLCRQAVVEQSLNLKSDGSQLRDFITLDDVTRATAHALEMDVAACGNGLFNLGGDLSLSVLAMTERIAVCYERLFGKRLQIVRPVAVGGNPIETLIYSVDKLKATGFALRGEIDRELSQMLQFCREHFGLTNR